MERPSRRNVDDPDVTWEDLALSRIDGSPNPYKVGVSQQPWQVGHLHVIDCLEREQMGNGASRGERANQSVCLMPIDLLVHYMHFFL